MWGALLFAGGSWVARWTVSKLPAPVGAGRIGGSTGAVAGSRVRRSDGISTGPNPGTGGAAGTTPGTSGRSPATSSSATPVDRSSATGAGGGFPPIPPGGGGYPMPVRSAAERLEVLTPEDARLWSDAFSASAQRMVDVGLDMAAVSLWEAASYCLDVADGLS